MIPKKIHYCWFGGRELPPLAEKCILSWKKFCPDYEIIRWDESTFDVNRHPYTAEAYQAKKYAFVTDYVRLWCLYEYGGIYMDTDVEVLKSLDDFLFHTAFSGFETANIISTGIMGSIKGGVWVKQELDYYANKHFLNPDGTPDLTPNTKTITGHLVRDGFILNNLFQNHRDIVTMYPNDFFSPKSWKTNKVKLTSNSHTIHHFDGSWMPKSKKILTSLYVLTSRIFGEKFADVIARILKP